MTANLARRHTILAHLHLQPALTCSSLPSSYLVAHHGHLKQHQPAAPAQRQHTQRHQGITRHTAGPTRLLPAATSRTAAASQFIGCLGKLGRCLPALGQPNQQMQLSQLATTSPRRRRTAHCPTLTQAARRVLAHLLCGSQAATGTAPCWAPGSGCGMLNSMTRSPEEGLTRAI